METKVVTYFLGKIITALISFAIIPLFISWFGEAKYGEYILVYTTFLMFISGSIGWINQSLIKFHGDYEKKERTKFYIKTHKLSYQISILTCFPLLCIVFFTVQNATVLLLIIIGFSFILACKYTSLLFENQAELNSRKFAFAEVLRLVSFFILVFIVKSISFLNILELIFLSLLFSYSISYFFLRRKILAKDFFITFQFNIELIKKFAFFGLPISIWMVFSPSANGIDRYVLNYHLGASVLAQYSAVYDIVFKVFTQLANPINSVYQPLLMKLSSKGESVLFKRTMIKAFVYLALLSTPVFILVCYFQDYILINYLGFKDDEVLSNLKKIIFPIAISAFIWQIAIILQKQLEAKGKTVIMALTMILTVSFFAIGLGVLVPKYGFVIAGYSILGCSIAYLILIGIIIYYENKERNSSN